LIIQIKVARGQEGKGARRQFSKPLCPFVGEATCQNKGRNQMNKKGFTIIELMIIVTIVCILAGIATGMYLHFRSSVKVSEAYVNISKIRSGEEVYRAEHDVYIPCGASPPGGGTDSTPDPWVDANGGFKAIGFEPNGPVRYQYEVTTAGVTFVAVATGDVDEDGVQVTLTVTESQPEIVKVPAGEL